MAWIESHQNLEDHPKIMLLCSKTGWNVDEAIGKLQRLWWWALKYAEDGDLSKYDPSQFLVRLDSKIDPKLLFEILKEVNFIEKNGLIHDWLDYSGRYLTSKYRTSNQLKLKRIEKKYKSVLSHTKVSLKSDRLPTLPNQPYLTNQPKKSVFSPPSLCDVFGYCSERKNKVNSESFVNFYESKGWMVGKNKMKDWRAAVRTWEKRENHKQIDNTPRKKADPECTVCYGDGKILAPGSGKLFPCDCTKIK